MGLCFLNKMDEKRMAESRVATLGIIISDIFLLLFFSLFSELAAFCWSRPPPRSVAGYQTAVICNKTTDLEQQPQQRGKEKAEHSNRDQRLSINIDEVTNQSFPLSLCSSTSEANK